MKTFSIILPCHFGLEAVLKREVSDLGYEIERVEDGRVTFVGDADAVCRANIHLRTAERVLICVGRFKAFTYDELFEQVKACNWEEYIPVDGKFWVTKATSVNSKLFSPSDIQSIVKKAIVERMKQNYDVDWFEESGAEYPIRVFFNKDEATVCLDTTGDSLHKRGYRTQAGLAPISETLAAALIMLSPWHKDRILLDPFCGSGTIAIEAAMIAANIAPGMNRSFTAEKWTNFIDRQLWYDAVDEAEENIDKKREPRTLLFAGHGLKTKGIYELVDACSQMSNIKLKMIGTIQDDVKKELYEKVNNADWFKIFTEGRGKVVTRAKYEIVSDKKKTYMKVTEIPYGVNKLKLVNSIEDKIQKGILTDIKEVTIKS